MTDLITAPRGRVLAAATLLLVAAALACAAPENPPDASTAPEATAGSSPRTVPAPPATGGPEPVPAARDEARAAMQEQADADTFQAFLDRASRLHIRHELESSLEVIRRALALGPPEPFNHRLRALELRVKNKLLTQTYVDAFVRFRADRYVIGDVIEGDIVFMNISSRTLRVPAVRLVPQETGDALESKTVFHSTITYREFLPSNTLVVNSDTDNFGIAEDIVLERGETYEVPVVIDTMKINPGGTMLRTYTLTCKLHAADIVVGEESFHHTLEFRPAVARVYPRNAEHLAAAPMARVKEAFLKASPVHMTLAASMVGEEQREELLGFLGSELEKPACSDRMADALMTCLMIVSGEEENRDKDDWVSWLKSRR